MQYVKAVENVDSSCFKIRAIWGGGWCGGRCRQKLVFVNPALSLPSSSKNRLAFSPFPEGIFGVFCFYANHCYYYQYYWRPTLSFVLDVYTKDSYVSHRKKVSEREERHHTACVGRRTLCFEVALTWYDVQELTWFVNCRCQQCLCTFSIPVDASFSLVVVWWHKARQNYTR